MKRVVVLTGAGISVESGIRTFRDSDGLWEGHDVMEVASPQGWAANQELVMDFYNQRRKQAMAVQPNLGHFALAELEKDFEVTIVTQNVDGLHERAGSSRVIHLHGELSKVRSSVDESIVFELEGWELKSGDLCPKGSQLRPHIVWFGEMVPMMDVAIAEVRRADILLVVGTSLVVYPAASLMSYTRAGIPKYVIDPKMPELPKDSMLYCVEEKASTGVAKVADELRKRYQ
ncbi:NAD-dependent deacetylase [Reichenbachiella agariperforans]|uniref:NAD-dependent protein deacylase n=1 Tax=Reichenbachiella agariperforans TaxID=156994 RepID=A0A1M6KVC6_REIAG|nr:NAD-dependent deacylase [Reichenbachiella agariperforans]SHJ62968.1 NAD-dependent deacetylase [Reichenbachiella agariperforans]